jgi:hypothetical protein
MPGGKLLLKAEHGRVLVLEQLAVDLQREGRAVVPSALESWSRLMPLAICSETKIWRKVWKAHPLRADGLDRGLEDPVAQAVGVQRSASLE